MLVRTGIGGGAKPAAGLLGMGGGTAAGASWNAAGGGGGGDSVGGGGGLLEGGGRSMQGCDVASPADSGIGGGAIVGICFSMESASAAVVVGSASNESTRGGIGGGFRSSASVFAAD